MAEQLNSFQQSLTLYAGYTGTTGGVVPVSSGGGIQLAGTLTVSTATNLVEFPVPATAKNIVITAQSFTHTGSLVEVAISSAVDSIDLDIAPIDLTDNDLTCQAFSPNGLTWCGETRVGQQPPLSGPDSTIGESISGTLTAPVASASFSSVDGDITAGVISIFYQ